MHEVIFKLGCITISIDKSFKERLEKFPWVNWSEIGREELVKRYLFHKYTKTGNLTQEEERLCEKIDWHPVDELPISAAFIKKLKGIEKGKHSKPMTKEQLRQWLATV
ncbi:MAG: hypothetical protein NT038_05795 [Euryarchaeota archaeon]|nr:hypothetical protein [Euryarchaeota archaeon]